MSAYHLSVAFVFHYAIVAFESNWGVVYGVVVDGLNCVVARPPMLIGVTTSTAVQDFVSSTRLKQRLHDLEGVLTCPQGPARCHHCSDRPTRRAKGARTVDASCLMGQSFGCEREMDSMKRKRMTGHPNLTTIAPRLTGIRLAAQDWETHSWLLIRPPKKTYNARPIPRFLWSIVERLKLLPCF